MPVVPIIGPTVSTGIAAPIQSNINYDQGVTDAENSLSRASNKFGETVLNAKKQADQVVVLDKRRQFEKIKDQELYSETGALTSEGKNAFEASNKAKQNLSRAGRELLDSLQNDDQKFMFDNYLGDQENDIGQRLTIHTSKEIKKYDADLTKSSLDGLKNRAMIDFSDPNKLAENFAQQEILIRQMGQRNGLPQESIENAILQQKSTTHMGILSKMAANEMDIGASKYFKAVENSMTEADKTHATKMLQEASYRGQAQRQVDQIMQSGGGLEEGLMQASKIQEPRLREDIENRLYRMINLKKQADNSRQEGIQLNALNLIDQGKGLEAIPAEQWSTLDDNRRRGIMSYLSDRARGKDKATDFEAYYDLKELAGKSPDKFSQINLLDYQNKLSNSDLKQMIDLQTGVKGGRKGLLDGFMSDSQVVKESMINAGITDKKAQAEFRAVVDSEVIKQKPKNNDELRKLVNEKLTRVITDKGLIWDSTKLQYQIDPSVDKIEGVKFDTIPREEKARISELLKNKGLPISEKTIEALYTQGLKMRINNRR